MKMAKPDEKDIDAAGNLMSLLHQLDRGDYPATIEGTKVPDFFDEDDPDHLRALHDAIKATLDAAPGYPGRVIGGMCYVILYDKNEIVDPEADVIELHPRLESALRFQEAATAAARDVLAERQRQIEQEGWTPGRDDAYTEHELSRAAACYALEGDTVITHPPKEWPWPECWWKPSDDRRNLVKAGALILAEIERIDRAAQPAGQEGSAA